MNRLAIFDLDGTLLDTVGDLGGATNHALASLGFPERPIEQYKLLCGRGIYNIFRGALPEGEKSEENIAKMKELFLPYYDAHMTDLTRPYPGIEDMMKRIDREGVKIALASNKYQAGSEKLMRHFFPYISFVRILGQRDGLPMKPDPRVIDEILSSCPGIRRRDVIYIGDSNVDMETGRNSEVRTIGVLWGFRTREELSAWGPWKIVGEATELEDAILGPWESTD